EPDDGLRDIVRIRGVLALERRCQGHDHGVGDAADLAIGLGDFDACGRLYVGEKVGRVSARLHLHDLDAELRDFVAEAVGQRFDRELARAVNAEERERHAAEDRADVDDRPSRFCRMEGSTARVTRSSPMTLVSKIAFACSVVKASVTPTEAIPALLTSTSIWPASASTVLTPASTDVSSLTSSSTVLTPSLRRASAASRFLPCAPRIEAYTEWPTWRRVSAVSRPKPLLAPVIRIVLDIAGFLCVFCCCYCGGAGWAGAAGVGGSAPARSVRRTRITAKLMIRVSSAIPAATRNPRPNPEARAWL